MDAAKRLRVRLRAFRRCEYCRIHEHYEPYAFHLEHIVPKKHGGGDSDDNLAWCCQNCNLGKGANLSGRIGSKTVELFNPRRQVWVQHFRWRGAVLVGKTEYGRATVLVLNINNPDRVRMRKFLIASRRF